LICGEGVVVKDTVIAIELAGNIGLKGVVNLHQYVLQAILISSGERGEGTV